MASQGIFNIQCMMVHEYIVVVIVIGINNNEGWGWHIDFQLKNRSTNGKALDGQCDCYI
jgi:hypothetical protein